MDGKRPKRRKDKYNPYTLTEKEDKHFLSFWDGQGVLQEFQITRELFEALNRFELDDLSILNEWDRHYEHSELTEASLYDRAAMLPESVEETVFRNLRYEALYKAMEQLPETQRRRLVLCITLQGLHTHKSQIRRGANIRQYRNPSMLP